MSGNGEFVLQAARKQVAALYAHYDARRAAAQASFADVAEQLLQAGALDSALDTYVEAESTLRLEAPAKLRAEGPNFVTGKQETLQRHLASTQRQALRSEVAGVSADFSTPLADFAHQLGTAEGRVYVNSEADSIVLGLHGQAMRAFAKVPGAKVTEADLKAFAAEVDSCDEQLTTGTDDSGERKRFADPLAEAAYRSAYRNAAVKRTIEWRRELRNLDRMVETITDGGPTQAEVVRQAFVSATAGVFQAMGGHADAVKTKSRLGRLANLRAEGELLKGRLAAWDDASLLVSGAWTRYLASPDGAYLRSAFGVSDGEITQQEFLDQLTTAAAGQEVKVVASITDRGSASGMGL